MDIEIKPSVLKAIHDIAEKTYPYECCGFIFGEAGQPLRAEEVREVVNNSNENHKVHYTIPPLEFMRAERYALENNKLLVGVFHSHPDHPPRPSARDLEDALPELSYFITSVHQGQALDTRSWRLSEQRVFQEETLKINYHSNN
ncbi:MAG TPA: M67 family metallopeptidase [Saprospiraceae bacterium]|nr:M67 family metallopeptidase [Saprospiraceae bacterium]